MKKTYLNIYIIFLSFFLVLSFNSCTISYKLNGASIDYSKIKSISIADFPNVASFVYPPLSNLFSETLRDKYTRQTRLQLLRSGGDLDLQGEIVSQEFTSLAISSDGYASKMRLTLTVNVRFTNSKNSEEDFEKRYSAFQTYDFNQLTPETAQETLLPLIINDIADEIYNDTVARW